jgi:sorting and assembly machinery component 37
MPWRYYVPGRLRESYRPRLEAAGLWNLSLEEPKETSSKKTLGVFAFKTEVTLDEKGVYKRTFEREKVGDLMLPKWFACSIFTERFWKKRT